MAAIKTVDAIAVSAEHTYPLDYFCIPDHYRESLDSVLIPHGLILDRVEKLAKQIVSDFHRLPVEQQKNGLVAICILKGGHQFYADLLNAIKRHNAISAQGKSIPISLEFIKIKSYMNDSSTGQVKISLTANETWEDVARRFTGKNLLVVEDIVDTGRTMTALLAKLKEIKTGSTKVSSLFFKFTPLSCGYVPDYVGFTIPDKFIVGYCLDYNEYFRDLDHVCIISDHGKEKYRK